METTWPTPPPGVHNHVSMTRLLRRNNPGHPHHLSPLHSATHTLSLSLYLSLALFPPNFIEFAPSLANQHLCRDATDASLCWNATAAMLPPCECDNLVDVRRVVSFARCIQRYSGRVAGVDMLQLDIHPSARRTYGDAGFAKRVCIKGSWFLAGETTGGPPTVPV